MSTEDYWLIEPAEDLGEEYLAYGEEFRAAGEPYVHGELAKVGGDFTRLLAGWQDEAAGRNLPPDWVPCTRYWLVRGRRIIGTSRLRHWLTPALEDAGGHIGYDVRPSERDKGHATRLLAMTLEEARELGLHRVLLTCDADNLASRRVIEKNGGRLASQGTSRRDGKPLLRFWIDLVKTT